MTMERNSFPKKSASIVYLSTFPPRECGIATFTKDLVDAMARKYNPALKAKVLAINDKVTDSYPYNSQVSRQIISSQIDDYVTLARELNQANEVQLAHIQHEFGIFGGDYGDHLIPFFQVIEKPVIVTLHTVLPNPDEHMRHVVKIILAYAKAVIVMNEFSKQILVNDYEAIAEQIHVIPHGIPYVASANGDKEKAKLGLRDRLVFATFGLLSKGKGIEYALRALPAVVERFPQSLYLILGVTHPAVRKHEGEKYRNFLEEEVKRLSLEDHVRFDNRYLSVDELTTYLRSADIYLATNLDPNQSVSGTLSYALGCGTAVISTSSLYARSIVTPECGFLVKAGDSKEFAQKLLILCQDPKLREEMGKNAYLKTRHMSWPNVALAHFSLYQKYAPLVDEQKLPALKLDHLKRVTDDFGIIQFARHIKPDLRYGYTLDDNARAIIAASAAFPYAPKEAVSLIQTYLAFFRFVQQRNGSFVNLVNGQRKRLPQEKSEDAQGRAIWALGYVMAQDAVPEDMRNEAREMFEKAVEGSCVLSSPRALSFAMIGFYFALQKASMPRLRNFFMQFAQAHVKRFEQNGSGDWMWFEDELTYSNSKLSESLFYAYLATKTSRYLEVAEKSLKFLLRITCEKDYFAPIGQNGWFAREGKRAYFDQQPEETSSMVQTLLVAYEATGKKEYLNRAHAVFQWFLGKNHLKQMVYDEATGGCYDGLGEESLNLNQGAESTLSYLLARLALEPYNHVSSV